MSSAVLAHLFGWLLKKHTIIAFSLYTAGARPAHITWPLGSQADVMTSATLAHLFGWPLKEQAH